MESKMKSKKFMMMIIAAMAAMVCIAKETRSMGLDGGCWREEERGLAHCIGLGSQVLYGVIKRLVRKPIKRLRRKRKREVRNEERNDRCDCWGYCWVVV